MWKIPLKLFKFINYYVSIIMNDDYTSKTKNL